LLPASTHRYPLRSNFELIPFRCRLAGGELNIKEHKQVKWLDRSELREIDWAEADIPILGHFLNNY
jgi:8-oxo-dGTP diphosphatase